VIAARNFCNKLWNIARFTEDKIGSDFKPGSSPSPKTPADHWILNRLKLITEQLSSLLDSYRFNEAYETLYHFVWDDLADWYVEASKLTPGNDVLAHCLDSVLRLAHPFAPFVTETIWQTLVKEQADLLISSTWPKPIKANRDEARTFEEIQAIVSEIRFIKGELKLRDLTLYHTGEAFIEDNKDLIKTLSGLNGIEQVRDGHGLHLTGTKYRCWLDIDQVAARRFTDQLKAKIEAQNKAIKQLEARLANKAYVSSAPKELVNQSREQLEQARELLAKMTEEHDRFAGTQG
jgi:valyl-tRNA synthetase